MSDSGSPSMHGVGDGRREILGRMFAPSSGQRAEVLEHVQQRTHLLLRRCAALKLRVLVAHQFLRQFEHPREVGLGHSEQRHDHEQRIVDGDLLYEVAFATGIAHLST